MELYINKFNLKYTLESGQFFRYAQKGEWYYCHERDKTFKIKQKENTLEFYGTTREHITKLFGLYSEYEKITKTLSKDPILKKAIRQFNGLRVMQRDPWETTINFQCSTASNIKKIQLNMNKLAEHFGKDARFENETAHLFPEPGQINNLEKIKKCSTGFRAKYIHAVNKLVDDNFFEQLKRKNYIEAKQELVKLPGIGSKVADCICLFSLGKTEAFPVDIWIERIMQQNYFDNKKVSHKKIIEFANTKWGKNAGYAQQFLYHWGRNR